MAITINAAGQDAGGDAILTNMGSGTLSIYSDASAPSSAKGTEGTAIATGTIGAGGFDSHDGDDGADIAASVSLTGTAAAGSGTDADHFRFVSTGGSPVIIQGSVGATSSGADLELDNVSIAEDQSVSVTAFTFTLPDGT